MLEFLKKKKKKKKKAAHRHTCPSVHVNFYKDSHCSMVCDIKTKQIQLKWLTVEKYTTN